MDKFKHTPGPWYIRNLGPHQNNRLVDDIEICHGDDECICDMVYSEADATLMAAAPYMLEVLIDCEEATFHMSERVIPLTLSDRVRLAIARATGDKV